MLLARSLAPTSFLTSCLMVVSGALVACGSTMDGAMDTDLSSQDNSSTSGFPSSGSAVAPSSSNTGGNPSSLPDSPTNGTSFSSANTDTSSSTLPSATSASSTASGTNTSDGAAPGTDSTVSGGTNTDVSSADATSDVSDSSGGPTDPVGGAGFYVQDGKLFDVNGVEFIMRGVNHAYTWFKAQNTEQVFADIASTGANTVRVVLSSGDFGASTEATNDDWTRNGGQEIADIIAWAKANKLVAMLEVHDATGYGDQEAAGHPNVALDYWTSDDVAAAIKGQEAYVLINIANESFGNDLSQEWEEFYEAAVGELRAAGIHHTLVVDAPFWGQDWGGCMRDGSTTNPRDMECDVTRIFTADPDANTLFSVHMYDVYGQAATVSEYFDKFALHGVPLIVGEFAADHGTSGDVDEAAIMQLAEERKIGYLGWSWSGNSEGLTSLDITVGFDVANLTPWGNTLIHGPNGLEETGVPCTCFD